MSLPEENKKYTYADYLTWAEDKRWEIINGVPFMQAAPNWQHQAISRELLIQFGNYLQSKACQVFTSPFDLKLPDIGEYEEGCTNVFQPDLVVVCDKNKLKGTGYYGVPDLVVEIVSPSTARNDKLLKFNMYEKTGVKEYWIVEPDTKLISVFTLQNNNRYGRPEIYTENDIVKVSIFTDLVVDLGLVFNI
jgi:Uma2 family endonuclease